MGEGNPNRPCIDGLSMRVYMPSITTVNEKMGETNRMVVDLA